MYYIYLLRSKSDKGFYIGYAADPHKRFIDHQKGDVDSTRNRRPLEMIYFEGYGEQSKALLREKSLKQFGSAYTGLLKRLGLK